MLLKSYSILILHTICNILTHIVEAEKSSITRTAQHSRGSITGYLILLQYQPHLRRIK